jgi:hypothetical protein
VSGFKGKLKGGAADGKEIEFGSSAPSVIAAGKDGSYVTLASEDDDPGEGRDVYVSVKTSGEKEGQLGGTVTFMELNDAEREGLHTGRWVRR